MRGKMTKPRHPLCRWRLCEGLSQKELAKRVGVDAQTISSLENYKGYRRVFDIIIKLCRETGNVLTPTDFFYETKPRVESYDGRDRERP